VDSQDTILFLCVANSARSQMAEALARSLAPAGLVVMSAGSEPTQVNPFAIEALAEIGLSTAGHVSKSVHDVPLERVHTVVTLCAEEVCPTFPAPMDGRQVRRLHWPHEDPAPPSRSAAGETQSDDETRAAFRRVRDQISERLRTHFA
jgi:arsenate reductase